MPSTSRAGFSADRGRQGHSMSLYLGSIKRSGRAYRMMSKIRSWLRDRRAQGRSPERSQLSGVSFGGRSNVTGSRSCGLLGN